MGLTSIDWIVVLIYAAAVAAVGIRVIKRPKSGGASSPSVKVVRRCQTWRNPNGPGFFSSTFAIN